uniref:Fucosyltransferase n=1 Tax=Aceria tosichella TaxID=561515 RepID=A0A6G1SA28_9ACAR
MREDNGHRARVIIFYLSVIFALIIGTLSLIEKYHSNGSSFQELNSSNNNNKDITHEDGHKEVFVWSSDSQDWALVAGDDSLRHNHEHLLASSSRRQDARDCIWPEDRAKEQCPGGGDRIINQLKLDRHHQDKIFKISVANDYSLPLGQELFIGDQCPVNKCLITHDLNEADAIVFPNSDVHLEPERARRSEQIWIAHFLESPPNTFDQRLTRKYRGQHQFNWTAGYRSDSDIVTPYAKFVPYLVSQGEKKSLRNKQHQIGHNHYDADSLVVSDKHRSLIEQKQTRVAWFASNCHAKNNRLELAKELARHIPVDIYGKCGNLTCNKWTQTECMTLINRDYKFYLAFENSNTREYITEKLYGNALGYNDQDHLLIPIVMGARREDYERLAPPGSFIHVDDFGGSMKELASNLKRIGSNNSLYYSYFKWKTMGKFIETKFMCRLCAMLHESHKSKRIKIISNLREWYLNE